MIQFAMDLSLFLVRFPVLCNWGIEILALRQQVGVLKRKNPSPRLKIKDQVFGILLRRIWPAWTHAPLLKSLRKEA
jgi:hypothetical protein